MPKGTKKQDRISLSEAVAIVEKRDTSREITGQSIRGRNKLLIEFGPKKEQE
jgi:hypothetical protein